MGGRWLKRHKDWLGKQEEKKEEVEVDTEPYGVTYIPIRCPKCNSKNVRCYVSRPPVRYHYCRDCEKKFKSWEQE